MSAKEEQEALGAEMAYETEAPLAFDFAIYFGIIGDYASTGFEGFCSNCLKYCPNIYNRYFKTGVWGDEYIPRGVV